MSKTKVKITKDMTIGELLTKFPEAAEVMLNHGLHCIGCHANPYESIEAGSKAHGMPGEEIDKMIKEMNEVINKPKKKE